MKCGEFGEGGVKMAKETGEVIYGRPQRLLLASIAELELRRGHNNKNAEAEMMTRK